MSFKAEIQAWIGWNWREGAVDNDRLEYARQLLEGAGSGQAQAVWHLEDQSLAEGASTTVDLTDLKRTIFGAPHNLALTAVKALLVLNTTAAGELLVGAAAADPWWGPFGAATDRLRVPPDSALLLVNRQSGWPVDGDNRNLKLAASGADVTYSVALVGNV